MHAIHGGALNKKIKVLLTSFDWKQITPVLMICLISLVIIFLVQKEIFIFGSVIGSWFYRYFSEKTSILWWIPELVILLIGLLAFFGTKWIHRHEKTILFVSLLFGIAIQVLVNSLYPIPIGDILSSAVSDSFYTASLKYSPLDILTQFQSLLPSLPLHAQSNMPGKILFFHLLGLFSSSPRILAYLVISVSSLGSLLLYGICKRLFHDRTVAYYALVLYCLIPCKLVFFPILNTVTPIFILACLYLLILFLDTKKPVFLVIMGVTLYSTLFFEPSPLALGILFVAILLSALGQGKIQTNEIIKIVLIPAAAFFAVHLIMLILFSFDIFQITAYMLKSAVAYNVYLYWIWILDNSKEFLYGMGIPVGLISLVCLVQTFSIRNHSIKNILRWPPENLYALGLFTTYLVVLFLGINRGEVTRLWIYLAVFFQVPAAVYLAKKVKHDSIFFLVAATLAIQAIVALQKVNFITP